MACGTPNMHTPPCAAPVISPLQQHHSETHDLISGTPAVCRQDHRMSSTYYSYTIATHLGELISIHAYTGWDLIMIGENAQMKGAKYETSWHMLTEIVQPKNRMEHFPLTHCVSFLNGKAVFRCLYVTKLWVLLLAYW